MSDSGLAIVVLAAGQGTRMKSSTPKLLHPLAGTPIVGHVLATVNELVADHVVVVVRHERDRLVDCVVGDVPGAIIVDQDEVPGTGRAAEQALEALPDDFSGDVLVLNGDVPLLDAETLRDVMAAHRGSGVAAKIVSTVLADPSGYGRVVRTDDGSVEGIVEHKDASERERALSEVNAGVYVFSASTLREHVSRLTVENVQKEKYLTDVVAHIRAAGQSVNAVQVLPSWKVEGINDRAQLAEAAGRLNESIVRSWQLEGVTIQDPASTWIEPTVRLANDVTVLPGTHLQGVTIIATGACVGPDTTLVDTSVGESAQVVRTHALGAQIGDHASVGPFAYLRPGTVLDERAKAGAFVETKNVRVGRGSKVPHLSYVGDAEIGVGTNIGAGTIIANYDGVNKHRTVVGDNARTGASNVFVAPVSIGDNSYTGAGAVIRNDVPNGSLGVSVAPQRNVEGWVARKRSENSHETREEN